MTTVLKFSASEIIPGAVLVEDEGDQRKIFVLERLSKIRFYGVTMKLDSSYYYNEFMWPNAPIQGWYMVIPE